MPLGGMVYVNIVKQERRTYQQQEQMEHDGINVLRVDVCLDVLHVYVGLDVLHIYIGLVLYFT